MNVKLYGFGKVLRDNDISYFLMLESVINSVDELCEVVVNNRSESIAFRIAPSHPSYLKIIFEAIKEFHYSLSLRVEFSKSIKSTATLDYQINLHEYS